jgi:hypothetical protein
MSENRGFFGGFGNDWIWIIVLIVIICCFCPGLFGGGYGYGCKG